MQFPPRSTIDGDDRPRSGRRQRDRLPSARTAGRCRAIRYAGIRPKISELANDNATVNPIVGRSSVACSRRGTPSGLKSVMSLMPQTANTRPAMPPSTPSTVLSASSCATSRPRPAPMAARTAISRARDAPRASSRFATLPHAMKKTSITAPSRMKRRWRSDPTSDA